MSHSDDLRPERKFSWKGSYSSLKLSTRYPVRVALSLMGVAAISQPSAVLAQTAITSLTGSYQVGTSSSLNTTVANPCNTASYSGGCGSPITLDFGVGTANNLTVTGFNAGAQSYSLLRLADSINFQRIDGPGATGERQLMFFERNGTDNTQMSSSYTNSMDVGLLSDIANRGIDNAFSNDNSVASNNLERIDYVVTNGINVIPSARGGIGFLVLERGGNDPFKVAAITSIDGSGNPTGFGPLKSVTTATWGSAGFNITTAVMRREEAEPNFRPSHVVNSQPIEGVFLSLSDLESAPGQTIFGYALFPNDISNASTSSDLVNLTNFPTTTSGASGQGGLDLVAGGGIYLADGFHIVSGTLYEDTNADNSFSGGEPTLPSGVEVILYQDGNGNSSYDVGEEIQTTNTTNNDGGYSFLAVADGTYRIFVNDGDPDVPGSLALGTPNDVQVVVAGTDQSGIDFGFDNITPPVGSGVCETDYNLVYSGEFAQIFAVHVDSGASLRLSNNALATANGLSTDHVNRQVYYGDANTLYAWSPLTNTHVVVDNNFTSYINSGTVPTSISSGGAAFFGGSVYQGSDIPSSGVFEIFKVDFVPGSNGLTIQSVTPIGIDALVQNGTLSGTPDWGDFIIDDTGVITANGNGGEFFWSYDLSNGDFIDLVEGFGTNSQLAKDGQGRLWALGANDVFQVQRSGNNLIEVPGTRNVTTGPLGAHSSFDAAECVRGSSSIGDFVWSDTNGDGVQDAGEAGIENVTVDLVWDLDGDGVIDAGEPVLATRTTDAAGDYDFGELIFGNYIVDVTDVNGVLAGATLTTANDPLAVTLPVGAIDFNDADFGYQVPASADVLLVKRITAINGLTTNPNDGTNLTQVVDDTTSPQASDDNSANWPANYLVGAIDGGAVKPSDELEYTVYFLNAGNADASDVRLCDRLLPKQAFITNAYGAGIDVELQLGTSAVVGLTAANDASDRTEFIAPSSPVPTTCNLQGVNDDGTLIVDLTGAAGTGNPALTNVPASTGSGAPNNAYGFFRFRTRITP